MSTPGAIARRTPITGADHPEFQISAGEWNAPLVLVSDAIDGAVLVRDRTQPDGWGFTDVLPAFLGVPPWRTINGHPLYTDIVLTPDDLGLGKVENVALSTWPGSAALTTLGTITTGTWQGNIVQPAYGGTGSAFVKFTGPTQLRTYTLPDFDATLLTSLSVIPPAQGGTGVTTGLTELNASNLTSGVVPDERLSGNIARTAVANNILWMAVSKAGSSLADLEVRSASDLNTGTLPIARLPPEVVLGPLTPATLPLHHVNHERNGSDAIRLDALALPNDTADLDASVARHGLLPRLNGQSLYYLNGHGLWSPDGLLPPLPNDPWLFLNGVGQWNYPPGSNPGAGNGNVIGPLTATHDHIAVFSGATGMVIADGGRTIAELITETTDAATAAAIAAAVPLAVVAARADIIPVDLATEVEGVLAASHLPANVQYKPILLSDLPPLTVGVLPAHHGTHDTGGSDALVALSAAILTTGTLPDARLSTNVALLNRATNAFTGIVTAAGGLGATPLNASQLTSGTMPVARLPGHRSTHEAAGSDAIKLDALAVPDDVLTLNATTARHGLLLKLSGNSAHVLNGLGAWAAFGVNLPAGTLAQQPTGLGPSDAGLLYMVLAPYFHLCRWNGSTWDFAPGDCGNGFFTYRPLAPQEGGWVLCNGVLTDYLRVGGVTLTVTAFQTPILTAGFYLKSGAAYTGAGVGASLPTLTGALAAAGAHGHTGTTSIAGNHLHGGVTDPQGAHSHNGSTNATGAHTHGGLTDTVGDHTHGVPLNQFFIDNGPVGLFFGYGPTEGGGSHAHALSTDSQGNHAHSVGTDGVGHHSHAIGTDTQGDHAHAVTASAVGDHAHGLGTLAISGTGEPNYVSVPVYFRR